MLFSSLALLLCQEPSLRWSRDVDEMFWQALHLLEVEERAEDAAATLASLLDEPSVQQFRGQTGYLLAQQYRALRAAGLIEEAEELLPSIRRDIANTEMAQLAESVITLADRTHPSQEGANEELLELLLSAAGRDSKYLNSVVSSYGERIVPELLMIFDRPEDYFSASPPKNSGAFSRLWSAAWGNDSGGFLDAMASRIRIRSLEYFGALPIGTLVGSSIGENQRRFLIRLSEDPRSIVAETGVLGLLGAVPDSKCVERLKAILDEGSLLSPLILDQTFVFDRRTTQASRFQLIAACLDCEDESIRAAARSIVFDREVALGLYHLAENQGDIQACRRLLSAGYQQHFVWSASANDLGSVAYPKRFQELIGLDGGDPGFNLPSMQIPRADGEIDSWADWRERQVDHEDRQTRELALASLLLNSQHDRVIELLRRDGTPVDFPRLVSGQNMIGLPELAEFLIPFLEDGNPQAERAWNLLSSSVAAVCYLRVSEFEWAVSHLGGESIERALPSRYHFQGSDDEWLARQIEILHSPILPTKIRIAVGGLMGRGPSFSANQHLRIAEAFLEAFPKDEDWNPAQGTGRVYSTLRGILDQILASDTTELSHERWDRLFAGTARFVVDSTRGKQPTRSSVDQGLIKFAWRVHEAGLPVRGFLEQVLEYPEWLERDRSAESVLLRLALLEGPELFGKWVSECESQEIECDWGMIMSPWKPSLVSSSDLVLELEAGLEFGGVEFERDLFRNARKVYGMEGVGYAPFEFLDSRLPEFMSKPHTASYAISLAVARGLSSEEFVRRARAAWAMPSLDDRHVLLQLISSRYTPELVPLLLDAQVSHSSSLAKIADEALARYARIRDARSGWAAWERQGREGSPIDALVEKTAAGKSKAVRLAAIQSLGTLEAKEALPFLVELLEDSDQEVVAAAQAALARIHAAAEGSDEE